MLSKLTHRTFWVGLLVAAVSSASVAAVAVANKSHPGKTHHQRTVSGWVRSNDGTTLEVRDGRARLHSYALTTSTKYVFEDGSAATSGAAKPGAVVVVKSTAPTTKGGDRVAKRVIVKLARVDGLVQSNAGPAMTVLDKEGSTRTIDTSGATCSQGGSTVACSTIAAESVVRARGHVDADGTTLDATRIKAVAPRP